MLLFAKLVAFVALAGSALADYNSVQASLTDIHAQVDALSGAVHAFPDTGDLHQALEIHTATQDLIHTIDATTSDVITTGSGFVADEEALAILASAHNLGPLVTEALNNFVSKRSAFYALPLNGVPALIRKDLGELSTSTTSLEDAFIAYTPDDLLSEANNIRAAIDAAFAAAIAAYS